SNQCRLRGFLRRTRGPPRYAHLLRGGRHRGQHRQRLRGGCRGQSYQSSVKPTSGQWTARALRAAGLVGTALAVWRGGGWALVAAASGFALAYGVRIARVVRTWLHEQVPVTPSDLAHMLDLLRRAHDASAAWAVGLDEE